MTMHSEQSDIVVSDVNYQQGKRLVELAYRLGREADAARGRGMYGLADSLTEASVSAHSWGSGLVDGSCS